MNQQEILKTLDLPFPCTFTHLHSLCQDPVLFGDVLSLAIAKGAENGRAKAFLDFNQSARSYRALGVAVTPTENLSQFHGSTFTRGLDNPAGHVVL